MIEFKLGDYSDIRKDKIPRMVLGHDCCGVWLSGEQVPQYESFCRKLTPEQVKEFKERKVTH